MVAPPRLGLASRPVTTSVPAVPDAVLATSTRGPSWAAWVDALPRRAADLLEEWGLRAEGCTWHGHVSWVLAVTGPDGPAVLKLSWHDDVESRHEHLALRAWDGDGAVRLLRADPRRRALLLERLEARDLTEEWDLAACEVVAGLYGRLHRPALPQLARLVDAVAGWDDDLAALPPSAPLPRRLVEQAVSLGRSFERDPATSGRTIHGDLHYANVLVAPEGPGAPRGVDGWLAIDPKPLDGDPHYEVAPLLWNRFDELAGDVRGGVRRRFHAVVDAAGLDEDRARDWVVVRMLHNASWELADAEAQRRAPDAGWLTACVSVAKAVQE